MKWKRERKTWFMPLLILLLIGAASNFLPYGFAYYHSEKTYYDDKDARTNSGGISARGSTGESISEWNYVA